MIFMTLFSKYAAKRIVSVVVISVMICLIFGYLLSQNYFLFEMLENKTYDMRVRAFRGDKIGSDELVLILIDSESLRALKPVIGGWQWPRWIFNDLLTHLKPYEPKAIVFDIIFAGSDIERVINKQRKLENRLLVLGTEKAGNVFHGMTVVYQEDRKKPITPLPDEFVQKFAVNGVVESASINHRADRNYFDIPFRELYQVAYGVGVENIEPDRDGIFRRMPFFIRYDDNIFPMMPFAVLINLNKITNIKEEGDKYLFYASGADALEFEKGADRYYLVNFYMRYHSISIKDILLQSQSSTEKLKGLKNKTVLIGTIAPELNDLVNTPIGNNMPGVFVQAAALSNILSKDFLKVINTKQTIIYMFIACVIIASMAYYLKSNMMKIIVPLFFYLLIVSLWIFLFRINLIFKLIIPSLCIIANWFISFILFRERGRTP